MSLIFHFDTKAYYVDPPLPVMVTIGWESLPGGCDHYFMVIEDQSKNFYSEERYFYSNLSDRNAGICGSGASNHIYFLSILEEFQIYIPFRIYKDFTDPYLCSADGIYRSVKQDQMLHDISLLAVKRYSGAHGAHKYYKYFMDLITGMPSDGAEGPPLETSSEEDENSLSSGSSESESSESDNEFPDNETSRNKNAVSLPRKKVTLVEQPTDSCYFEIIQSKGKNNTYVLNYNPSQWELNFYSTQENEPQNIPVKKNFQALEKELNKITKRIDADRKTFTTIRNNKLISLLNLPENLMIGKTPIKTTDDGGFFDALKQSLSVNSELDLRIAFNQNEENPASDECENSVPILSHPIITDGTFCRQLSLERIVIIEIANTTTQEITYHEITSGGYLCLEKKEINYINNNPILVFSQKESRFLPILSEERAKEKPNKPDYLYYLTKEEQENLEKIIKSYHSKNTVDPILEKWNKIFSQLAKIIEEHYQDNYEIQEAAFIYQAHLFLNNANYTADEKRKFGYSSSPLQNETANFYLRTHKNLPIFEKSKRIFKLPEECLFINIDANFLENTLQLYFKVERISKCNEAIQTLSLSTSSRKEVTCILIDEEKVDIKKIEDMYGKIAGEKKLSVEKIKEEYIICYVRKIENVYVLCYPLSSKTLQKRLNILLSLGHVPDTVSFYRSLFNFFLKEKTEKTPEKKINIFSLLYNELGLKLPSFELETVNTDFNLRKLDSLLISKDTTVTYFYDFIRNIFKNLDIIEECCRKGPIGQFVLQQFRVNISTMIDSITLDDFIANFQYFLDTLVCFLAVHPLKNTFKDDIQSTYQTSHLGYLYDSFICNYGMSIFTNTVNAAIQCFTNIEIEVFNQGYFEALNNMDNLNHEVKRLKYTDDIKHDFSIIFMDIHPNNAVESELYSHQLKKLLHHLYPDYTNRLISNQNLYKNKKIIVIDATLNIFLDDELKQLIDEAMPLIQVGLVNLVILQSLTKFGQLSGDIFSGGGVYLINDNSDYWKPFNRKLKEFYLKSQPDSLICNYFSLFLSVGQSALMANMDKINKNTLFFYDTIKKQLNQLNFDSKDFAINLTDSIDPHSCYVAFNYRSLTHRIYQKVFITDEDIACLNKITIGLIVQLSHLYNVPLTQRQSIGFATCNINQSDFTIRLTIGLENEDDLKTLANLFTYVCYALKTGVNKIDFKNPEIIKNYFSEVTAIFKFFTVTELATKSLGTIPIEEKTYAELKPNILRPLSTTNKQVEFSLHKEQNKNVYMSALIGNQPHQIYLGFRTSEGKIEKKPFAQLPDLMKMLVSLFIFHNEETGCKIEFNGTDLYSGDILKGNRIIEITNFIPFSNSDKQKFTYMTSSFGKLLFTLDENELSISNLNGEKLLTGNKVLIHKDILGNFGVLCDSIQLPEKRKYSKEQIREIELNGWQGFLAQNLKTAEEIETSNHYIRFSSLPDEAKQQIFPKLAKTNMIFTNSIHPQLKKNIPVKLNIESKKYSVGNGFDITNCGTNDINQYVLTIFAIKQPILNLFCQYVCFLSICESLEGVLPRTSIEQVSFKIKSKSIHEQDLIKRFSHIVSIFLHKNREIRKLIESKKEGDILKTESQTLKNILRCINDEVGNFNELLDTEYEDSVIEAITIKGKNHKDNKEVFAMIANGTNKPSNIKSRAGLSLQKRARNQTPKTSLSKGTISQTYKTCFFPRVENKLREGFKEKLINDNKGILEYICNLTMNRENNRLHVYFEFPAIDIAKAKEIYAQLGYWLKYDLQPDRMQDFDAKKSGLFIVMSSSQEAKDLKNLLKETVDLFLKDNINYVTFRHESSSADSIYIAGSFNQWLSPLDNVIQDKNSAWRMRKDKKGTWSLTAKLDPGEHKFKYVINNYLWENSTNPNHKMEITSEGYCNSILTILENKPLQKTNSEQNAHLNTKQEPNAVVSSLLSQASNRATRPSAKRGRVEGIGSINETLHSLMDEGEDKNAIQEPERQLGDEVSNQKNHQPQQFLGIDANSPHFHRNGFFRKHKQLAVNGTAESSMADSKTLIVQSHQNPYGQMEAALNELKSNTLADTEASNNEVRQFLFKKLESKTSIVVAENSWELQMEEEDVGASFPLIQFFDGFLGDNSKNTFVLPMMPNAAHHSGLVIEKYATEFNNKTLKYVYLDPDKNTSACSQVRSKIQEINIQIVNILEQFIKLGPDASYSFNCFNACENSDELINNEITPPKIKNIKNLNLEQLRKMEFEDKSCSQQKNNRDCGYITGQSLYELAIGQPLSIPKWEPGNVAASVKAIAQARANFGLKEIIGVAEEDAKEYIKKQYYQRLSKAIYGPGRTAEGREIQLFIESSNKTQAQVDPILNGPLFEELRHFLDYRHSPDYKSSNASDEDELFLRLSSSEKLKALSVNEIKVACQYLLQYKVDEKNKENVYYVLKDNLIGKARNRFEKSQSQENQKNLIERKSRLDDDYHLMEEDPLSGDEIDFEPEEDDLESPSSPGL